MHEIESPAQLIAYLPASSNITIGEILKSMHRCELRNRNHHNEKRGARRDLYDNWVAVIAPIEPDLQEFLSPINACIFLRGRNISTSGISVIGSYQLDPVVMTDDTPILRLDHLLCPNFSCSIGLSGDQGMSMTWLSGEVVRSRNTQTDLVELGLKFLGRLAADHPIHKDAELLFQRYRESES